MPTALDAIASLTGGAVTEAGEKTWFTNMRTYLAGLLGTDGDPATARLALRVSMSKMIAGLTYANNAGDATNDIDIAAGACMDATGVYLITLAAITKRLDAGWAVGTNQGGLDTGSIANTDYYLWAIARSDTGVTDVLFSASSTAPTMPANYDYKRLIGWIRRQSATILSFKVTETEGGGIYYKWVAPQADLTVSNTLTTARRTDSLSVPQTFATIADLTAITFDASSVGYARIMCPDENDVAVTAANGNINFTSTTIQTGYQLQVPTSTTGTVSSRASVATVDSYVILSSGFRWGRRN